ncbi:MAG: PGF-CTERM sorting domain-containing protein [Candidatus Thalassarchaeaceae archaeon]|nr:PGF-CTERM sorting domain-containing protein [Candidatus Thalassarchaeaceae archaeon]
MTRLHVLIASLILVSAPLAGCLDEELIDDILGCMDENAANYDDNATSELVGDCIYMATMETFIDSMNDVGSIEDMLEETPKAGYSQSISSSEWNQDLGMQMDVEIEDIVMADLDNDAVYVHNSLSIVALMQMEYTHVQVGEIVNVHYSVGGMMAQGEAESGSYQTRDATPNVLEVIAEQSGLFSEGDGDDGDDDGDDEFPEDAEITITMSDDMESQTMTMAYTEDGAEITMTIHIDQNEDLMSFSMESDNGSATSSMTYEIMWGDSIVIEVDETLPKTSNPIWFEEGQDEDDDWDDEEDTFHCDNGNEVPMDHVDDGWDDCGDGSDEFDDGGDDGDDGDDGDGPPTPEEAMETVDANGDGYMSYQEFQDAWDSDPENPELDYDEVTILFDDCDYDDSDLIDIDEMQCFIDGIVDTLPDEGDEDPGAMFGHIDTDEDGYVSIQDIIDFSNENEAGDDSDDDADEEGLSEWFSWCDTDGDDLLNLDEFTTCVEDDDGDDGDDGENDVSWMDYDWGDGYCEWNGNSGDEETVWWCKYSEDDEDWDTWWYYCEDHEDDGWHCTDDFGQSEEFEHSAEGDEWSGSDDDDDGDDGDETFICDNGDEVPMDWVNDGWDDCGDGSDEFDDGGDDDQHDTLPESTTLIVAENQTLNAPIIDFEAHFLSDCAEEYDEDEGEMIQPDLSDCTIEFSIPLTGGEAEGVTIAYTDHDGDGLVSPGDEISLEWGEYEGVEIDNMEFYDTWASEYSSDSAAMPPALPGFGAVLGALGLLGAAIASRRD